MEHLTKVFESLQQHHLAVKLSKCTFVENKVEYLGHVISSEGVTTDPRKIRAIQEWGVPSTTRQVKGFLGLAGYYRSFIKNFAVMSHLLNGLLKKDVKFLWAEAA